MSELATKTLDEIALGGRFDLEELVDRQALGEVIETLEQLFEIPMRFYTTSGKLLADATLRPAIYGALEATAEGRAALQKVIAVVREAEPGSGEVVVPCVTGAEFRVSAVLYEGRSVGRVIIGPYLSRAVRSVPPSLAHLIESESEALEFLQAMAVADARTIERIVRHLRSTLDLLLFSGLRALLASNMHIAAVTESFRELQDKNAKLQQAYERLKELDRLKSNFLATVSHELRTPLTSIIGYSEMLREGLAGELSAEQHEFVGTIYDKGEQLLELIKSLLDLSKLESGTMRLRWAEVELAPLVHDVVATLTPTATKRGVSLVAEVADGLPPLCADGERLRQVLNNLSENAIKFTPAGGTVVVGARRCAMPLADEGGIGGVLMMPAERPAIALRVADSGIGISDEERERVFDAFYQVDGSSTREQGGAGLGLSIVKRLVDSHNGTIEIERNHPRGTVFVVTIPLSRDDALAALEAE